MAKGKRRKKKPGSGYTPPPIDEASVAREARSLLGQMDPDESGPRWGELQRLLVKAKADPNDVAGAIAGRDLSAIEHIINVLEGLEEAEEPLEEVLPEFPQEVLRDAMKAFRKRFKLMRLDHESKLGRSPLSTGKDASFESILPPEQFPTDVWPVLVSKGELESTGRGFYKIPTEKPSF